VELLVDYYKDEMVEDLARFIKIPSVKDAPEPNMPYGRGIFDALMYILNRADKMDFECVNLFGHMGYIDYGDGDEMLAILTHIDVVPAGEGWTKEAFGGEIDNGRVYGRGAIDNKGPAIAALYALKALSDNSVTLHKKVRLIFGCDEESGWSDMLFYKQHESLPDIAFSPDGDYPIINAEKGLIQFRLTAQNSKIAGEGIQILQLFSGERANIVPNKAECLLKAALVDIQKAIAVYQDERGAVISANQTDEGVLVTVNGKSAHASRPEAGVNAAAALIVFLSTLPLAEGSVNQAVMLTAQAIGHTLHGENCGLDVSDDRSGRLSFNLGMAHAADDKFSIVIDIRYPISYTEEIIRQKISDAFESDFKITLMHTLDPHYLDENSELIQKLKEAYEETTGEKAYCVAIGGATYARAFENAVTFGARFPQNPHLEHGPDEYIEIGDLVLNAKIIANAIVRLCAGAV
jgi:succinyl-diaminopimelate desuccinylase